VVICMAGTNVGQLFVSLGFDVDSKALESFDKSIKGLSSNMLELLGVSGVTAYGINKFVTNAMSGAQSMHNLAQGTRIATAELHNYASVISYLNPSISAAAAAGAISDLDNKLNDWRNGFRDPGLGQVAGRAGIEIGNMNATQFLDALAVKFKNLSPEMQSGLLRSGGLPHEFLNYLNASSGQLKTAHDAVDMTTHDMDSLAESSRRLQQAFDRISTFLEKTVVNVLDRLEDKKHNGTQERSHSILKSLTKFEDWLNKPVNWILGNHADRQKTLNELTGNNKDLFSSLEMQNGLQPGTLKAVMNQESGGNPNAVNPKSGAQGAFQFMPATAKQFGIDPFNFNQSAWAAAKYLGQLKNQFGNNEMALAAYNWGPGNLQKYGISHAPKETRDYVNNITIHIQSNQHPDDLVKSMKQSYQNAIFQRNNAAVA